MSKLDFKRQSLTSNGKAWLQMPNCDIKCQTVTLKFKLWHQNCKFNRPKSFKTSKGVTQNHWHILKFQFHRVNTPLQDQRKNHTLCEIRDSITPRLKLIFAKWPAVSHELRLFTRIFLLLPSHRATDNDFICRERKRYIQRVALPPPLRRLYRNLNGFLISFLRLPILPLFILSRGRAVIASRGLCHDLLVASGSLAP